jgi:mono/diheme cytochrome c family protein
VDESSAPLTPILHASDPETASETLVKANSVKILVLRDSGIARWCLSENPTAPASADAPCASGLTGMGTANGWSFTRPTSFNISSGEGAKSLYLYVANQSLKINATPATYTNTADHSAPAPASISSIQLVDTQVANLSVAHANEADVSGWCVWEQSVLGGAPGKPGLGDDCWKWTDNGAKPTTVGFRSGGTRNVWIFVRDKAGNVSNASNMMSAQNPYGEITYTQLIDQSGASGNRAIFANRCFTCHGQNGNPGFSKLELFKYLTAVDIAKSGTLVSRINNPLSPMPNINGGLMPQRDRDLIRLWTMPEQSNELAP